MKRPPSITGENGQERSLEGLLRGYSWRGLRLVAWNRYTQGRTRPGSLPCNVHQHGVRSGPRGGRLEDIQTPAWWGPLAERWEAGVPRPLPLHRRVDWARLPCRRGLSGPRRWLTFEVLRDARESHRGPRGWCWSCQVSSLWGTP